MTVDVALPGDALAVPVGALEGFEQYALATGCGQMAGPDGARAVGSEHRVSSGEYVKDFETPVLLGDRLNGVRRDLPGVGAGRGGYSGLAIAE